MTKFDIFSKWINRINLTLLGVLIFLVTLGMLLGVQFL
jgi:hypothetical protein